MEGMPRVPMLTPDLKFCLAPLPTDFSSKIKEYILLHYQDDPAKYDNAINEIENMRSKLSRLLPDVETLSLLKRYYSQLCLMKNRFPMEKGDAINVAFSWVDRNSDASNAAVFEDINYELACVMHNIGAVHGAIAANETRVDLDSVKNAFMHFQCAAYPFGHIRDTMNAVKYSTVDFDPSVLTFYVTMLLAQAQECLLEKSIIDHRKNTVIAKLAIHLKDVYMQCREHLNFTGLNDILSSKYKEWLRTCTVKSEMYGAIAMLYLGLQAEDDNKMGFRVYYFDLALEHVAAAMKQAEKDKRESLKEAVIFLNDIVVGKQRNAKKENDFIYHDRLPKPEELSVIEGVNMVKAVGFDPTDRSVSGPDLFASLLPGNVLKSLSVYSEEKAKFKRILLEEIEEKDKELEDYIKSLQLEEINFDDESKMEELPEMLLERSAAFNSQPDAFPELLDKLHRVGECAIEADHIINNLRNRLGAINSLQLRADEGFAVIMKELDRVNDHHMKARANNAELQRVLAAHSESLKILAMPLNELRNRLKNTLTRPADSTEGLLLKKMLNKANEMSSQRRALLSKLNEDLLNDDITAKCLAEKNEDNQRLYENELKKHEKAATLIHMNLAAQNNILSALTDANASFGDYRKKIVDENKNRMEQVLALTAAYDVYIDVSQKTEEGLKFYSTLFSMVKGLGEAVEAIEIAFEEEKKENEKEMLRELEKRTAASAVRTVSAENLGKGEEHISVSSGSVRNEGTLESGYNGLRLKDCLEYYRNNIAKGTVSAQPASLPHRTRQSHPMDTLSIPCKNEIPSNQTLPTEDAVQFSQYRDSSSLQSHCGPMYNQSIPNISLNSTASGFPRPYMFSNKVASSSHSLEAGKPSSGPKLQTQYVSSLSRLPVVQPIPTFENPNPTRATATGARAQQVNTSFAPPAFLVRGTSQPIPDAVTMNSIRGPSVMPQNITASLAMPSITSSNPALLEQSAIAVRPGISTNAIAAVEVEKPVDGIVLYSHAYASSLVPNKMHSNFAGSMVPNSANSTFAKPIVNSAHHLMYSQDSAFRTTMSPWHQPLGSVNDMNELLSGGSTRLCSSAPTTGLQPFVQSIQAAPVRRTPAPDIMNAPLDVVLPAPLTPTHPVTEVQSIDSSVQMITVNSVQSSESIRKIDKEGMNVVQVSQSPENVGSLSTSSAVVQTPRPAAAVAPIMQTDCNTTSACDSTLSITNVTSMSYSSPLPQTNTTSLCTWSCTKQENGSGEEGSNSRVKEVMDPQTFTIGNADPVRLEKRYMRQQFKTEGTRAHLPPLDPTDPINCIDAHYWLNKS